MSSKAFFETVKARRTYYQLKKESTISDEKIQDIITQALLHVPSSFNSQSTRIILLVKEEHNKLWDITKSVLKGIVPAEQYSSTEQRLNGFQAGYGTVCEIPSHHNHIITPARDSGIRQAACHVTRETLQSSFHSLLSSYIEHITNYTSPHRSSSSKTATSSPPSKKNSPSTPTNSPAGPPNPTP